MTAMQNELTRHYDSMAWLTHHSQMCLQVSGDRLTRNDSKEHSLIVMRITETCLVCLDDQVDGCNDMLPVVQSLR